MADAAVQSKRKRESEDVSGKKDTAFSSSQSESSEGSEQGSWVPEVGSQTDGAFNGCAANADENGMSDWYLQRENDIKSQKDIWVGDGGGKKDKRTRPISYKAYHRQIEKRRRCKINDMISEIANLVPMCKNVAHRLDKLTVLELAVQHMRMVSRSVKGKSESPFKPSVLSEEELKQLLENSSKGFLIVLSSDHAQILYVSENVAKTTNHAPTELVGRSLFDIIHSKDVATVTDMLAPFPALPTVLSSNDNQKTSNSFQNCVSGSKRLFYCRMKSTLPHLKDRSGSNAAQPHIPLLCEGLLKSWDMTQSSQTAVESSDNGLKLSTFTCFIGVVKAMETFHKDGLDRGYQYSSKHSADAKFLSVDPRVYSITDYIPQDLVGASEYTIIHKDDVNILSENYRLVLEKRHQEKVISDIYRLNLKHGGTLPMRTVAFSLFNPFTKELEFISHQNFVVGSCSTTGSDEKTTQTIPSTHGICSTSGLNNKDTQKLTREEQPINKILDKIGSVHDDSGENCGGNKLTGDKSNSLTMNLFKKSGINMDIITNILNGSDNISKNSTKVSPISRKKRHNDSGCENSTVDYSLIDSSERYKKHVKSEYDDSSGYCSGRDGK